MRVLYFPKYDDKWNELRPIAYLAIVPDDYDATQLWFWMVDVHGVGERGNCQLANLENLFLGQIQPDKTRKFAYVTEDTKLAVDKYGMLVVCPTYGPKEFFDYSMMQKLIAQVKGDFSVTPKFSLGGFSYGGGATVNSASSSLAPSLTNAWPIAPTENVRDWANTRAANVPMHFFVNDNDDNEPTNLSHTLNLVNGVNSTKNLPVIKTKAQYTAFRKDGHGDHNRVTALTPPTAPGGQGVLNVSENIYEWSIDCWKNGPRQMKTGTISIPPTIPPTIPTVPTTAKADFNIKEGQIITTNSIELDASASTGVINNNYYWEVTKNSPPWVGQKLAGGAGGGPKKLLSNLTDGPYSIRLTINGDVKTERRLFEVKIGGSTNPVPTPTPTTINIPADNLTVVFPDGSLFKLPYNILQQALIDYTKTL